MEHLDLLWVSGAVQRRKKKQKPPHSSIETRGHWKSSCSASYIAALPGPFDHVPQILWERAIIPGIRNRDATSRNHDWVNCAKEIGNPERGQGYSITVRMSRQFQTCTQWLGTESNRRHADFQSAALPTELPSRPTVWTGQLTQSRSSNQPASDQRYFCRLVARPGASIAWVSKSWSSSSVTLAQLEWRRGSRRRCVLSSPSKQIQPS